MTVDKAPALWDSAASHHERAAASPLQCQEKSSDHIVSPQLSHLSCSLRGFFPFIEAKWRPPFVIQEELHIIKLPNCLLE